MIHHCRQFFDSRRTLQRPCRWDVIFLALLGPLLCGQARAAAPGRWDAFVDPVFHNYSQTDGLPNPVTTALAEDGDGFLWVGTQGGLARWDGYRFRNYKPDAGNTAALPDTWVTTLHTDPHGQLWVGTSAGGLARYDREHDSFVTYAAGGGGLSNVHVLSLTDDGSGGLWIATEGGLDHLDPATGHVVTLHHTADPGSLPDNRVLAVLRDRSGALWVGTRHGLARQSPHSDQFVPVTLGDLGEDDDVSVGSLFEDPSRRVWIGTTKQGAFVVAPREAHARSVEEMSQGTSGLQNAWIYTIGAASSGEIWLGTEGQGIIGIDTATGLTRRIRHDATLRQSLVNDTIFALYRDRAGGMWVGTTGGLGRLDSFNAAVQTVFGESNNPRGLRGGEAASLLSASDGRIWVGVANKGIDILDPRLGRVMSIPADAAKPETALPDSFVMSIAESPAHEMFIGTNRGLYRATLAGTGVTRLTVPGRDPRSRNEAVREGDGKLWIGGADDGLWAIVPGSTISGVEHFDADRLTDRRVVTMALGSAGDLWIGTAHGLNRLEFASRRIEHILPVPADPKALSAGYISSLLLDGVGRLWVGTNGSGIEVMLGREAGRPVFRRIGIDEGLPDGNVDSMLADATGRIWAATDNGIAVIDPVSFAVHTLHHSDGVAIAAYWSHSAAATPEGDLLFGGAGLTIVRPDRFHIWNYRPPIAVTEVRVGGRMVPAGRFNRAPAGTKLIVPPDANSLAVEFSALDYSAPESNRYAYRLQGFDAQWITTDPTRRIAAYTNLPPGNYTLHLRGSNRNGLWTETTLDLPIQVLPDWYQTLLFKVIVACAGLACILALVQSRTIYLRQRQRELERKVAERTSELEASKGEIEESKRLIEDIAYHDALTGLPNRRLFIADVRKLLALAEREDRHFALLLVDLDHFKQINDSLGHDAGDATLVEATKRLQGAVRLTDIVCRVGGDEFTVLVGGLSGPDTDDRMAVEAVCRRVVDSFAAPVAFRGNDIKTTASIGVGMYPEHGRSEDALYKAADMALYDAKRAGRNTWRWHAKASETLTH